MVRGALRRLFGGRYAHALIPVALLLAAMPVRAETLIDFSAGEIRRILSHGPWPPDWAPDPGNRVSGRAAAIAFGAVLFAEPRLSADGDMACATCHQPERGFTDGRARGRGRGGITLDRNTLGLRDLGFARWFGWDGAGDSLWAQSLRPILDPREMAASPASVAALVRSDGDLACRYGAAFGRAPDAMDDTALAVDLAKALAAFQETLISPRAAFDDFRDALARGDRAAAAHYPAAAQRGLRLFIGAGQCATCHLGPAFTNGEFHDIGRPHFAAPGRVDPGRHGGVVQLKASPFNRLGPHSDDRAGDSAVHTRHVALTHRNWGEFKVPGLRNAALTAPYMHDGSLATLRDVVRHYSEIDDERLHADGERLLKPLRLGEDAIDDLVAFLGTLTSPAAAAPLSPPAPCGSDAR